MIMNMIMNDKYLISSVRSALVALVHIEYFLPALTTPILGY